MAQTQCDTQQRKIAALVNLVIVPIERGSGYPDRPVQHDVTLCELLSSVRGLTTIEG